MLVMSAFALVPPLVFHCFDPGLKKKYLVIILLCVYLHVWLWGGGSALNHTYLFSLFTKHRTASTQSAS